MPNWRIGSGQELNAEGPTKFWPMKNLHVSCEAVCRTRQLINLGCLPGKPPTRFKSAPYKLEGGRLFLLLVLFCSPLYPVSGTSVPIPNKLVLLSVFSHASSSDPEISGLVLLTLEHLIYDRRAIGVDIPERFRSDF